MPYIIEGKIDILDSYHSIHLEHEQLMLQMLILPGKGRFGLLGRDILNQRLCELNGIKFTFQII